jgi:hypothetical protein
MSAINRILDRLVGVKQSAPDRWMSKCPSHEDKTPSLSIRELQDGRILINCFAGCGAVDVLAAIGLQMSDLFDRPLGHHLSPIRGGFSASELLELNAHEATVVALLASDAQLRQLTPDENSRLMQAAARLAKAQAMAYGR